MRILSINKRRNLGTIRAVIPVVLVCLVSAPPFSGLAQESPEQQMPPTARLLLRVALVDEELNIKPVPRFAFLLQRLDQAQEPIRLLTDFHGNAEVSIQPGVYRLKSKKELEFGPKSFEWLVDELVVAEGQEVILELSDDNAIVQELLAEAKRRIAEETFLFQELRNGVVTVEGELGTGSGFIVDPAGIVLTNQHVIRSSKEVSVELAPERRVRAVVLKADPQKDVAALWVNLETFPEFVVLPLAKPREGEAPVVEGEKVLAIGSPLSQRKILTVGVVSKVEDKAIISDINVNPGNSGGPLINSLGEVVGIVTFGESAQMGPGISGIVRVEQAESVLREAREAVAASTPPSGELLPVEPEIKYPLEGLSRVLSVEKFEKKHYRFGMKKYDITLLTPVLKWYFKEEARIEAARQKEKDRKKKKGAVRGTFDPLEQLRSWAEYVGEYDAVVQILAAPEVGPTGGSIFWSSLAAVGGANIGLRYKFKADFYEMSLLCDGSEVAPIRRGKIEHVGALPKYVGTQAHYTFAGIYTYPYEVFDSNKCRQLELRVFSEEDPTKAATKIIEPKYVQAVWGDFEPYRKKLALLSQEEEPQPE